jgi:hypothetical protein
MKLLIGKLASGRIGPMKGDVTLARVGWNGLNPACEEALSTVAVPSAAIATARLFLAFLVIRPIPQPSFFPELRVHHRNSAAVRQEYFDRN